MCVQFLIGNVTLYVKYSLNLPNQYPYVLAVFMTFMIFGVILWQFVVAWFGKKTTMYIGFTIFFPVTWVLLFLDYFPLAVYVVAIFLALGGSCIYLVTWYV